ncbi:PAS domain-containing protein [Gracilimonas sp.]|uniref:PAS domain-containing sensor histidine kinase n=1 Tax=Gracilimonas sp. TaxID=1974203 RepID=UPI0032ECD6D8
MNSLELNVKREGEYAFWSWNLKTDALKLGTTFANFFGCSADDFPSTFEEAKVLFTKKDLQKITKAFQDHTKSEGSTNFTAETSHHTINKEDYFKLVWEGEIIQWKDDKPVLVVGQARRVLEENGYGLSASERADLFKKLMNHLPDSIFFKDKESRFIAINNACAKKFGLQNPKEAIGKTDFDFFDDEHAQQALEDEKRVMETEQPIINKIEKEGSPHSKEAEHWASTTKIPLYDYSGKVIGTFGITRDISNQRKAEEVLKKKDATISRLSEQVPGFFYLFHYLSEGKACFPYASAGIRDIYELEPEEVKDSIEPVIQRIHKDDINRVIQSIQNSSKNLTTWEIDYRVVLPENGLRWVRGKAKPERQPDGTTIGYGYVTDITEEKRRFEHIARLRRQLQKVIDSAPNLIFVKNLDGEYLMANKSAAGFFGRTPEEMVGKRDVDIGVPKDKALKFLEADKEVISKNEPLFIPEDKTILPDGTEAWHQTIKVPFPDTDSGKAAVLSIVTDITRRKRNEIELRNSLDIIGEQNKRLKNFAHIVSHNLRNHAGNISMLLSLYDMEESQEEKEELLSHLGAASKRLNESIADLNEIIDQQYKKSSNFKELNLQETIERIKEILTTEILANNVKFEEEVPENLSFEYNPAYLESILLNLLSNAIKYRHPERKPRINIDAWEENDKVFLQISDNGLGIDLEKHGDELFGMYNTFHGNENAKGIGLYITKNQIESMGGSIEVDSIPGEGTTFKILLK